MIPEGTDATNVTEDQIAAVIQDVDLFCKSHGISRKDLAQVTSYAHATISEFLSGKYKENRAEVAINLEQWLTEEEQRRSRPATTSFTWTNTANQIKAIATYALDYRKIAMVYGPDSAGIGKTTALQAIYQTLGARRAALATIDKVDANPTGLLKKLCHALHITDSGSTKRRFDAVVDRLKGRSHLLMIDQIHNLRGAKDDKPFYILADLFDATNSAQLWCGTADLVAYLNRQRAKVADESLAQIRRRIFPCVDLMEMLSTGGADGKGQPLVSVDQVVEMFRKNKLRLTPSATRFLAGLINHPDTGGVGFAVQIVEYATMLAGESTTISVELLKSAMCHGITTDRTKHLLERVAETEMRIAKVG